MRSLETILHTAANTVVTVRTLLDAMGKVVFVLGMLWIAVRRDGVL